MLLPWCKKNPIRTRLVHIFLFHLIWTMEVLLLVTTTSRPCLINPYSNVMARAFALSQQKEYKCHNKYIPHKIVYFFFLKILFSLFGSKPHHTWFRPISYHYFDISLCLTLPLIHCWSPLPTILRVHQETAINSLQYLVYAIDLEILHKKFGFITKIN